METRSAFKKSNPGFYFIMVEVMPSLDIVSAALNAVI
jgi:hypothetical protein